VNDNEHNDIEAEAEAWRKWNEGGRKTHCLGTVAAMLLFAIVVIALPFVWLAA